MAFIKKDGSNTTAPPRGQKSLTSFFGAAKSRKTGETIKPRKVQSSIKGGLKKQQSAKQSKPEKKKPAADEQDAQSANQAEEKSDSTDDEKNKAIEKDNVENCDDDEPSSKDSEPSAEPTETENLMDTDDEDEKPAVAAKKRTKTSARKTPSPASRKRVIEDDSSDDDDAEDEEKEASEEETEDEEYHDKEDESEEELLEEDSDDATVDLSDDEEEVPLKNLDPKKDNSKSSVTKSSKDKSSPKSKKQKTLTGTAPPKLKPTTKGSKSEAAAKAMKSNSQLSKLMEEEDSTESAWEEGKLAPYSALCDTFCDIEAVSGRLDIQEKLCTLFRKVLLRDGGGGQQDDVADGDDDEQIMEDAPADTTNSNTKAKHQTTKQKSKQSSDLYTLLYLTSNSVAPQHANVELGVGDSILIKAIGEASGTAPNMIKKKYHKEGDLGTVAMSAKGKQKTLVGFGRASGPRRLSCWDVLKVFKEIANTSGSQSQKWKVDKIKSLLVRAKGTEPKYIIRGLQGKLRIGLAQSTVLASLAHAIVLTHPKGVDELSEERMTEVRELDGKEGSYPDFARKLCGTDLPLPLDVHLEAAVAIVKKAYMEVPSYDSLLDALLAYPLPEIHKYCTLLPGIPVGPMLAKPTKSVQEVLKRLDGARFTCEYKYDGERAQVHMLENGEKKVFSRSLLNTSEKFPEVPLYVQESCKETNVTSFVLDTEVVAFNRETKQFVPFQVLSTRKRTEESAESAKVQVIVQAFDLMFLNGVSLLDRTLAERRDLMKKNFLPIEGKFQYATSLDHTENGDTALLEEFLDAAVKGQCEGLMVKTLDVNAAYEPSRRSLNWLKLKKDYLDGLGDSVDLVPLGAYHGKGKRTGVYGAYLLACYDEDTEQFQSVCKIGTGFSEENLKELAASLNNHTIPEKSSQYNVSDSLGCDVWFDAVQVWEVKAADLSKSSTHKGAIDKTGESGRGIGLRFPRFERIRPDKKPENATSSDQILDMYYAQDSIVGGGGDEGGMDMDGI